MVKLCNTIGSHEVGLFKQDSHYSIFLILTLCLLSNLVKINEEHFLGKVRYVFLPFYLCIVLCEQINYCKSGNFRVTFVSRIFYFRIISEFLNSRVSVHVFFNVYSDSLLARTLNSRGNQFANISEN